MSGFIKMFRGPVLEGLLRGRRGNSGEIHHFDLVILTTIAERARYREGYNPDGVELGEAMLGDWESMGMTRKQATKSLERLKRSGLVDFRTTPGVGTLARITNPLVFDPLNTAEAKKGQNGDKCDSPTGPVLPGLKDSGAENGGSKGAARGHKQEGKKGRKEYSPEFERFWRAYPRKVGKKEAFGAFQKVLKIADCETLMSAVASVCQRGWADTEERYIPHASTWLNKEQWRDLDATEEVPRATNQWEPDGWREIASDVTGEDCSNLNTPTEIPRDFRMEYEAAIRKQKQKAS